MALTRKTFNFSEKALNSLAAILEVDGYNETDTVNRALILNASLLEYMEDGALTILTPDGEKVKIVLI